MRMPLKFGAQVVTKVVCARVRVRVEDGQGRSAEGWGETPLSVAWVWPSGLTWEEREARMQRFCVRRAEELAGFGESGQPMEIGHAFEQQRLGTLLEEENREQNSASAMPHL